MVTPYRPFDTIHSRRETNSDSKQAGVSVSPGTILVVAAVAAVLTVNVLYLRPRYGGILAYFLNSKAAGSFSGQTEGNRDKWASALAIYYSDTDGKYPPTLEELQAKNYISDPLPREDVFIEVNSGSFKRAHWYRNCREQKRGYRQFPPPFPPPPGRVWRRIAAPAA